MKIGLVVSKTFVKRPFQALQQMEAIMQEQAKQAFDLLVFPQAYLQGIYAISDNSKLASKIALKGDSKLIKKICNFAQTYCLGVAFGFYEKDAENAIYDSFMLINREGKVRSIQRQLSNHWAENTVKQAAFTEQSEKVNLDQLAISDLLFAETEKKELLAEMAQEDNVSDDKSLAASFSQGEALQCSYFGGKRFLVLIGRDLVTDSVIDAAIALEPDVVLCPDALALSENAYLEHKQRIWPSLAERFNCPLLLVNSYYMEDDFVKGGALAFHVGRQTLELPLNEFGVLEVEL